MNPNIQHNHIKDYKQLGTALASIVNPQNKPLTVYYGGAAHDIEFPIVALNSKSLTCIDFGMPHRGSYGTAAETSASIIKWLENAGAKINTSCWNTARYWYLEFQFNNQLRELHYYFGRDFTKFSAPSLSSGFDIHISRGACSSDPIYLARQITQMRNGGHFVTMHDLIEESIVKKGELISIPSKLNFMQLGLQMLQKFSDPELPGHSKHPITILRKVEARSVAEIVSVLIKPFVENLLISIEGLLEIHNSLPKNANWMTSKRWREEIRASLTSGQTPLSDCYLKLKGREKVLFESSLFIFGAEKNWIDEILKMSKKLKQYLPKLDSASQRSLKPRAEKALAEVYSREFSYVTPSFYPEYEDSEYDS